MVCREYRRLCRSDIMRQVHVKKFTKVYDEIKKKLAINEHHIQQEYFKTQQEVLVSLVKRNLGITGEAGSSIHQGLVISILKGFMEKLQRETRHMIYINTLEFQDLMALLFAFFLKTSNNFHELYMDFCKHS